MPAIVLDLLKYVFLIVLYVFIARAVRIIYLELRPPTESGPVRAAATSGRTGRSSKSKSAPKRAAVVEGEALRGQTFDLGDELIVGRASKCHVVLEDDPYVSQMHARIFARDGGYLVEDLGSTNGTYLNRRRISSPAQLQRGDQVKIGKTVLEMRK